MHPMNEQIQKFMSSPLEDVLNIESGTTLSPVQATMPVATQDVPIVPDEEDGAIKEQLQTVFETAMEAYEYQQEIAATIDPSKAARNAEVAAQFLKIALDSTSQRSTNKANKDRLRSQPKQEAGTINNNLIVTDRNTLLKSLQGLDQ